MRFVLVALLALLLGGGAAWLLLGEHAAEGDGGLFDDAAQAASGAKGRALLSGVEGRSRKPSAKEDATKDAARPGSDLTGLGGLIVHGKVVNQARAPLENAEILIEITGREAARGTTDEHGEYRIGIGGEEDTIYTWIMIRAQAEGPLVGYTGLWFGPSSPPVLEAQPIVATEAQTLEAQVVYGPEPVGGAQASVVINISGQWRLVGECVADELGTVRFEGLPRGNVQVLAAAKGHGRASKKVTLPRTSEEAVLVELTDEAVVEVTVEDQETGDPIPGARIEIQDNFRIGGYYEYLITPAMEIPPTDENGRTVLRGLAEKGGYSLLAQAEGYPPASPWGGSGRGSISGGRDTVTLKLRKPRTIRFPIGVGKADPPADGESIEVVVTPWLKRYVKNLKARVEGHEVVWDDVPTGWVQGQFLAKSGAAAGFHAPQQGEKGRELKFGPIEAVTIELREKEGGPVAGVRLRLERAGMLADSSPQTTGEDGRAVFSHVQGKKVRVHLLPTGKRWGGLYLGQIDLEKKEEVYVLEIAPAFELTLDVVIDGSPGLPGAYTLSVGNQRVEAADIVEDPTAGRIETSVRKKDRKGKAKIQLSAQGYLVEKAPTIDLDQDPPYTAKLELKAAGSLNVQVDPPADGKYSLKIQRFDPRRQRWVNARYRNAQGNQGRRDDGSQQFDGLDAGTYRVIDNTSNIASESAEVELGVEPAEVHIDLRDSVLVSGVVKAPAGAALHLARVRRLGIDNSSSQWSGIGVNGNGRWSFRSRRGERLTVSVYHPVLRAAARSVNVGVVAGQEAPPLYLESGDELHFRLTNMPRSSNEGHRMRFNRWGNSGPTVHLVPRDDEGAAPIVAQAQLAGTVYRLGVPFAGRYDIHVVSNRGTYPPIAVENRMLGSGITDLGLLRYPPTARVVFDVAPQPSPQRKQLRVSISHLDVPQYSRSGYLQGNKGEEVVVSGLGPGRFRVRAWAQGGSRNDALYDQEVEIGSGDTLRIPVDVPTK